MNFRIIAVLFVLICAIRMASPDDLHSLTIQDIEMKLHRNNKNGESAGKSRLLKVAKKTAALMDYSTTKFYYVVYHSEDERPLKVEFSAKNKNGEEFSLPERGYSMGTGNDQWDWEVSKGYLPKFFSKTKAGRRVTKFEHNKDLTKKYGQIQAYKVKLLDGETLVDTIEWNWDKMVTYKHGLNKRKK